MIGDRPLLCEILTRFREAREQYGRVPLPEWRAFWNGRADALYEIYAELKGLGYDARPLRR